MSSRLLQTGLFKSYIPIRMWVITGLFFALIISMHEDLYVRFMAHASLNALICGTGVVVIVMAFRNAFAVQAAANFLKKVEEFETYPDETKRENLIQALRNRAHFIDSFYLQQLISEYKTGTNIVFDDNQARIIKGKIGHRSTHMRNNVQYIAGVLVMLGLIGTFWGLLETITSVGDAMQGITKTFASAGSGDSQSGMVSFLTSISKPLQGMGIAFSASLFGLSGSLLGGLLNNFCSKGMDKFIEHYSIWIDTRIPTKKQMSEAAAKPQQPAAGLEGAMAQFQQQMTAMFVQFSGILTAFTQYGEEQRTVLARLSDDAKNSHKLMDTLHSASMALCQDAEDIRASVAALPAIQGLLVENTRAVVTGQQVQTENVQTLLTQQREDTATLRRLLEAYTAMVQVQDRMVHTLSLAHTGKETGDAVKLMLEMQRNLQRQLTPQDWAGLAPAQIA